MTLSPEVMWCSFPVGVNKHLSRTKPYKHEAKQHLGDVFTHTLDVSDISTPSTICLVGQIDFESLESWRYLHIFTGLIGHTYASDV